MSKSVPQLTARTSILGNDLFHIVRGNVDFKITWTDISNSITAGSGTLNRVAKWTPSGTQLGDSQIFDNGTNVGVNIFTGLSAKLHVKGAGNTSATNGLIVENSSGTQSLVVRDDGFVGVGTNAPLAKLHLETNNNDLTGASAFFLRNTNNGTTAGVFNVIENNNSASLQMGILSSNHTSYINYGSLGDTFFYNSLNAGNMNFNILQAGKAYRFITAGNSYSSPNFTISPTGIGILVGTPNAMLHVKGSGSTSATNTAIFENSSGAQSLVVRDDGFVGVGTGSPEASLHIERTGSVESAEQIIRSNGASSVLNLNAGATGFNTSGGGVINFIHGTNTIVGQINTSTANGRFEIKSSVYDVNIQKDSNHGLYLDANRITLYGANTYVDTSLSVGISTPNAASLLELDSTTRGFRLMRMTATQASAITAVDGLMLYVTDTNGTFTSIGFWGYENGSWVKL